MNPHIPVQISLSKLQNLRSVNAQLKLLDAAEAALKALRRAMTASGSSRASASAGVTKTRQSRIKANNLPGGSYDRSDQDWAQRQSPRLSDRQIALLIRD